MPYLRRLKAGCNKRNIVYCQEARNTCNTVSRCTDSGNRANQAPMAPADHTADERLHQAKVDTEDSRLSDTQEAERRKEATALLLHSWS